MITEDYVSYEVAKLLKEKGFPQTRMLGDFITNMIYKVKTNESGKHSLFLQYPDRRYNKDRYIAAPTYQMILKWLRKKDIIIVVQPEYFNIESKCSEWGCDIWCNDNYEKLSGNFPTYEETIETAIKYSLENLL